MEIEFDPAKNASNIAKHGIAFEMAAESDLSVSIGWPDVRFDYGEERLLAIGPIHDRLHVLIYRLTATGIRIISLRKANKKEVRIYEKALDR